MLVSVKGYEEYVDSSERKYLVRLFKVKAFMLFDNLLYDNLFHFVHGCECDEQAMVTRVFSSYGRISSDGLVDTLLVKCEDWEDLFF